VDAPAGLFENVDCSVKVAPRQKFLPLVDGFLLQAADKWFDSLITWLWPWFMHHGGFTEHIDFSSG